MVRCLLEARHLLEKIQYHSLLLHSCVCARVCVCACVRAYVRACVCVCEISCLISIFPLTVFPYPLNKLRATISSYIICKNETMLKTHFSSPKDSTEQNRTPIDGNDTTGIKDTIFEDGDTVKIVILLACM